MRITNTGLVGIGTTTPLAELHISGASADKLLQASSPTNQNILFVSGSGNIGIGTTTPTNTLEVNGGITSTSLTSSGAIINGNVTVTGTASINTLIVNQTQLSTGSNQLGDNIDDTQTLYGSVIIPTGSLTVTGSLITTEDITTQNLTVTNITASGNIRINNNSSIGGLNFGTYDAFIRYNNNISAGGISSSSFGNATAYMLSQFEGIFGANDLSFYAGSITQPEIMRIVGSTGRVGIGESSPSAKLEIKGSGTTSTTAPLKIKNTNNSTILTVLDNGSVYSNGPGFISSNIAFGEFILNSSITGQGNVLFGRYILTGNTTGQHNSAFGINALSDNITGEQNVAFGNNSLTYITTSSYNTAIGYNALGNLINGDNNIAIGNNAGVYLLDNIDHLTKVSSSIFIGTNTLSNNNDEENQIVIGYNASGAGSNSIVLGNTFITTTILRGNVTASIISASSGITGSLFGTASFAISASQALSASYIDPSNVIGLNLSRISTGSITASVDIGTDTFKVQSGSSTFFTVNSNGNTTINNSLYIIQKASIGTAHQSASLTISASSAEDAVLVKINDNNVADKFKINNEGVMVLGSLDNTPTAIEGGIFYSSSNDYFLGFI
jgi:hypothetical protein